MDFHRMVTVLGCGMAGKEHVFDYGKLSVPAVVNEVRAAAFGDARLTARLESIGATMAAAPSKSFPEAADAERDLQGIYRFFSNARVSPAKILAPHIANTLERMQEVGTSLVVHDTTEIEFDTEREGLGHLRTQLKNGLLAHISLAVSADGMRRPLGTIGFHSWVRTEIGKKRTDTGRKKSPSDYAKDTNKESERWFRQVQRVEETVNGQAHLVHLMDRESDNYVLFANLIKARYSFVSRLTQDRCARIDDDAPWEKLKALVGRAEDVHEVQIPISARKKTTIPGKAKTFSARGYRKATLRFAATRMQISRPKYLKDCAETLSVNVVHVYEVDAPPDVEPVEWLLVTTEPIDTREQVIQVVEYYRARWLIEELNKAIKTGCEIEERQLETYEAIVNALALFLPIAWQMLVMRGLADEQPDAPAEIALTPTQIQVLKVCGPYKLPDKLTVKDALHVIARMGGYLHRPNRRPGWQTLGKGMDKLMSWTTGWMASKRQSRTDE
jgi:hypothetical protein